MTHSPEYQAPRDQSFHKNPLLTAAGIIFGLSLLQLSSLVNIFLLYLGLAFSFGSIIFNGHKWFFDLLRYTWVNILYGPFFQKTQELQRMMNVISNHKWILAAPCENQGSDRVQANLSILMKCISSQMMARMLSIHNLRPEDLWQRENFVLLFLCLYIITPSCPQILFPPIIQCSYSKLKHKPLPNYRSTNLIN